VGPLQSSQDGLIRVVISTQAGQGVFSCRPVLDTPGEMDIELFGNRPITIPQLGTEYPPWIPSSAATVVVSAFSGCSGDGFMYFLDPYGGPTNGGPLNQELRLAVPTQYRGRLWTLNTFNPYPDCSTHINVHFETAWGQAWTPTYLFRPNPDLPIRAELPTAELFLLPGRTLGSFVPRGYGPDDYPIESIGCHFATPVALSDREEYECASLPGSAGYAAIANNSTATAWVEYWTESGSGPAGKTSMNPNQIIDVNFGGSSAEILHIRAMQARKGQIQVSTSAPLAVAGPNHALRLSLCQHGGGSSDAFWFWVPPGLGRVKCDLEASAIRVVGGLTERYAPNLRVTFGLPNGEVIDSTMATGSEGRWHVEIPTVQEVALDGELWSITFHTTEVNTGANFSAVFNDEIPPYFSRLGPGRFFIPVAHQIGPQLQHNNRAGIPIRWNVNIPGSVYCSRARACRTGSDCDERVSGQTIIDVGEGSTEEYFVYQKEHHPEFRPWIDDWFASQPEWFYEVASPEGLTASGNLLRTDVDSDGRSHLFTSIYGSVGACQSSAALCLARADSSAKMPTGIVGLQVNCSQLIEDAYARTRAPAQILVGYMNTVGGGDTDSAQIAEAARGLDVNGTCVISIGDEPFDRGYSCDELRRTLVAVRSANKKKPVLTNEEVNLANARDLRDIVEIWADEEYYKQETRTEPLCTVLATLKTLNILKGTGVATGMHTLGGYQDGQTYVTAEPDAAGAQGLASLLFRTDVTALFARFWSKDCGDLHCYHSEYATPECEYDWERDNVPLWERRHVLFRMFQDVARWLENGHVYHDALTGLGGSAVSECQVLPVCYGYGDGTDGPSEYIATWFAAANLGEHAQQVLTIPWSELRLGGLASSLEIKYESSDASATYSLVQGAQLQITLAPHAWVVGLVKTNVPAAVAASEGEGHVVLMPNPVSGGSANVEVWGFPQTTSVSVFDVSGRRVKDCGTVPAGTRGRFQLTRGENGVRGLSSGVYFLDVRAVGGRNVRRTMVVLR
jgi:hypothetical protein